ncbi:PD-(D/E)XK nuclease family protein [Polaribacter atrinae]|uniref:PDDEXK-like family protein n=1 Tax=Polaribacter atrinae TaxID=1333662 RepID=UPI0030F67C05
MNIENFSSILAEVKAKKEAYRSLYIEQNKVEAFDFNLFDFFRIGENKISQLLAFLLNPKESHGQGDLFLRSFFLRLKIDYPETDVLEICCEKTIENKRRLDIYIRFKNYALAIENKVWAADQYNQLRDYNHYLNTNFPGAYHLIYLNPYGNSPSIGSMQTAHTDKLKKEKRLKILSYTKNIIPILDSWANECEAPRVVFFINELKMHFKNSFLGTKSNVMKNELKDLIYQNKQEVVSLVSAYEGIFQDVSNKHEKCSEILNKLEFKTPENVALRFVLPFDHQRKRVSKYEIVIGSNKVFVQLVQDGIKLHPFNYCEEGVDAAFEEKINFLNLENEKDFSRVDKGKIVDEIVSQVERILEMISKE